MTEKPTARDTQHYDLVGKVAAAWATLDLNLDVTISMLTGLNNWETACITSQFASHYPKLRAIVALCKLKGLSNETIAGLNKFAGNLGDLTERRNRAVHDAWIVTREGKIAGRINLKTHFPEMGGDPADELRSLIEAIAKRIEAFKEFRLAILREMTALQQKQP